MSQHHPAKESFPDEGPTSQSSEMSGSSEPTFPKSTFSPGDSPAKTSLTPGVERVLRAHDPDFGPNSIVPFAYFDRDSSSWKTCQVSLHEESGESCTTWPKQGTWDLGFASELVTSARRTRGKGSSSSPELLPTPMANDDGKSPEAHMRMKANLPGGPRRTITSLSVLARAGFKQPLLPTPGANDANGGELETRKARRQKGTGGPSLRDVGRLLPTPTAQDAKHGLGNSAEAERNPHTLWATLGQIGASTDQPLSDGSPSSESPHPDQLTIEDV